MINNNQLKREVIQLFLAARNFIEMAEKSYANLDQSYKKMTIKELAKKFECGEFTKDDKEAMFMLSYLLLRALNCLHFMQRHTEHVFPEST